MGFRDGRVHLQTPSHTPTVFGNENPTTKQEFGLSKKSDLFALLFQPARMSNSRQTSALLQWGFVSALNL